MSSAKSSSEIEGSTRPPEEAAGAGVSTGAGAGLGAGFGAAALGADFAEPFPSFCGI